MNTVDSILKDWSADTATVIVPSPFRGGNATMVTVGSLWQTSKDNRPIYAYRLCEVTEGGPVFIFEGTDLHGSGAGVWPEPAVMCIKVLDWFSIDPSAVGDGYGENWSEQQVEWNSNYEWLSLVPYDFEAAQIGNAHPHELTSEGALAAVTKWHHLTWNEGTADYVAELLVEQADDIEALERYWSQD